jgi:NAD(P)-dependent dehydrogenase (short-subunit alcohol dehydrogenase family)
MSNELAGKVALVTGGSRVIGRAAAVALAKAHLYIGSRTNGNGTYLSGLSESSTSTNMNSILSAVAQGVAQGILAGVKTP